MAKTGEAEVEAAGSPAIPPGSEAEAGARGSSVKGRMELAEC